jgi:hypothetical protein
LSRPHQRDFALQKQISQVTVLYGLIMAIMPDDLHQGISKIPAFGDVLCKYYDQWNYGLSIKESLNAASLCHSPVPFNS